uniref:Uncharacterized protein n=1 Tax=Salmo trutta TaxID=8032 RepID=A0A673Y9Y6_SALTR
MATRMDTLPDHLLPLTMEVFPQPVVPGVRLCSRGHRELRFRMQTRPSSFSDITEEEEGGSSLEEDHALRSFLKTLESLRWSTQGWPYRIIWSWEASLDLASLLSNCFESRRH